MFVSVEQEHRIMPDLLFLVLGLGAFALMAAYAVLCAKL